jgi:hypothetical protein
MYVLRIYLCMYACNAYVYIYIYNDTCMYAVPLWNKQLPVLTPRQQVPLKMPFIFVL